MSQGQLSSPTSGTVSGLTLTENYNAALLALASMNSGASAPDNAPGGPVEGQMWLDQSATPPVVRIYDGANWLALGALDDTAHLWKPPIGGGLNSIASASTVDLGSVPDGYVVISGTTGVTRFGTSMVAGALKVVEFGGALTLAHDATAMILPTGADIPTEAGDTALALALGGGNFRVVIYQRADGTPLGQIQTAGIADNAATNAKLAEMATATLKGNAAAGTANAADLTMAQVRALAGLASRGQLFGLTLANDSVTPASVIDIAAGEAASDTSTPTLMVLGSAFTKSLGSTWSAGTGNGGLDTGTVADGTYHVFLIGKADGTTDILLSTSATAPAMPTGYVNKRRTGSIVRASGSILGFAQDGDDFYWASSHANFSGGSRGKSALTVTVPSGIRVKGHFQVKAEAGTSGQEPTAIVYDGVNTSIGSFLAMTAPPTNNIEGPLDGYTSTSAQIQFEADSCSVSSLNTIGWTDTRGRLF